MAFSFVHTADIHLDSPLKSLALRHQELSELIANATRKVFLDIIDLCLQERVDALLIAGDLYDGSQTSMKTAGFLAKQLRRLDNAGIRVFIIRGNHDAASKITRELTFPDNVHVFSSKAQPLVFDTARDGTAVAVHGISFEKPHAPSSLLPRYAAPIDGVINVGLMHTSLDGSEKHDPYAPCKLSELLEHGFDYWALGHIHKRNLVKTADCTVLMPGIPQGRDSGEAGDKSVSIVTIHDDKSVVVEERVTSLARFEEIVVPLDNIDDWEMMLAEICRLIEENQQAGETEHLVARIILSGESTLAWRLMRDLDVLQTEIKSRLETGQVWIDKLKIRCQMPSTSRLAAHDAAARNPNDTHAFDDNVTEESVINPVQELQHVMVNEVLKSAEFQSQAADLVEEFQRVLPAASREKLFGASESGMTERILEYALAGTTDVLARLQSVPTEQDKD